jgi:hypothetical protein
MANPYKCCATERRGDTSGSPEGQVAGPWEALPMDSAFDALKQIYWCPQSSLNGTDE